MRKFITAIIVLLLVAALVACGRNNDENGDYENGYEEEGYAQESGNVARPLFDGNITDIGRVWMKPRGDSFVQFLTNLDQWETVQGMIDFIGYADHVLFRSYTSTERIAGFATLNQLDIPLVLEIGGVKHWGLNSDHSNYDTIGRDIFYMQHYQFWQRFVAEGANIAGFAIDEPLVAVMFDPIFNFIGDEEAKFNFTVEQTAQFIALVRYYYPDAFIGNIEVFPSFSIDLNIRFVDALEARLVELTGFGQDFYRMDVDWSPLSFTGRVGPDHREAWAELVRFEQHLNSIGLPHSLIYWGADYHDGYFYVDRNTDRLWHDQMMRMGAMYKAAGGNPDQFVLQTWVHIDGFGIPYTTLPEDFEWSFTNNIIDFFNTFIEPIYEDIDPDSPGDISGWNSIGFDVATSGWTGASTLEMRIASANGYKIYDVTEFVHFTRPNNTAIIPLDYFVRESGIVDLGAVTSVTFQQSGGPGSITVSRVYVTTPRSATHTVNAGMDNINWLTDGGPRVATPRTDSDFENMIFYTTIPRTNFSEWEFIELDVYVGDVQAFRASGNSLRLMVGSSASADSHEDFQEHVARFVLNSRIVRSGWNRMRFPVASALWPTPGFDMSAVSTLWFYLDYGASDIVDTTIQVRNIYLSYPLEPAEGEEGGNFLSIQRGEVIIAAQDLRGGSITFAEMRFAQPINLNLHDAVEFELYISDLAAYRRTMDNVRIKISSHYADINWAERVYLVDNFTGNFASWTEDHRWVTVTVPLTGYTVAHPEHNPTEARGFWLFLEPEGGLTIESDLGVRNVRITGGPAGAPQPPLAVWPPPGMEGDPVGGPPVIGGETRALVDGTANFTLPQQGEHWMLISWPVGAVWPDAGFTQHMNQYNPVNFTEWGYLQFDLMVQDVSAVPGGNDWRVRLVSGYNIDGPNNLYSFREQVQAPWFTDGNWHTISIPLQGPTVVANPAFDMTQVMGLRIFVEPDESHNFTVSASIRNVRLAGLRSGTPAPPGTPPTVPAEAPPADAPPADPPPADPPPADPPPPPPPQDIPTVPISESHVIFAGTSHRNLVSNQEAWFMILWPVATAWPDTITGWDGSILSYDNPIDLTPWTHLTFDIYVSDVGAVPAGNDWRFRFASGGNIDNPAAYFSFGNVVRSAGFTSGGWNTVSIPLHTNRLVEHSGFNASNATGLRFWVEPDESSDYNVRVGLRNIRLTR